jgi:N,N'-diacetyl-8-epilegionaminate cytidylyltransferase
MTASPAVVAFVFARGGSKGLPRKNLRTLAGRPLIAHAVEVGRACPSVDRVIVSTDDDELAAAARHAGAEVPWMRPAALASDEAPEWLAWRHAVEAVRGAGDPVDVLVSLPATAPLRTVADVEACLEVYRNQPCDAVVTVRAAERNPWFNMVRLDEQGFATTLMGDAGAVARRQDAPSVYDLTTVCYVAGADYVLDAPSLLSGQVRVREVPRQRSLDIDDAFDLTLAELLYGHPAVEDTPS